MSRPWLIKTNSWTHWRRYNFLTNIVVFNKENVWITLCVFYQRNMATKFIMVNFFQDCQKILFYYTFSSSRPELFCKKGILKNFAKFTGKHLCQSPFFNKQEFLRTSFSIEHLWWLLLHLFSFTVISRCFLYSFIPFFK